MDIITAMHPLSAFDHDAAVEYVETCNAFLRRGS